MSGFRYMTCALWDKWWTIAVVKLLICIVLNMQVHENSVDGWGVNVLCKSVKGPVYMFNWNAGGYSEIRNYNFKLSHEVIKDILSSSLINCLLDGMLWILVQDTVMSVICHGKVCGK